MFTTLGRSLGGVMDEVHTDRGEERVVGGVITVRGDAACDLRLRGGTVQQGFRR